MLPLSVKINDITDDQVMPQKVKNYPIIYEAPFPIFVNLRKFRSCSKRSNIFHIGEAVKNVLADFVR